MIVILFMPQGARTLNECVELEQGNFYKKERVHMMCHLFHLAVFIPETISIKLFLQNVTQLMNPLKN